MSRGEEKPLAIDLFCGLGGWTEGLLAENFRVVGFDIEQHVYGEHRYPAQLVVQDVLTLHGSQFRNAALIVASPPCQAYSYRAMPWKRAKALPPPDNALFDACFRIQREACAAAGRHIPLVVENVRGAQKWVGRARWNFGSFYLWGDVPALMPMIKPRAKSPGLDWNGFKNGDSNYKGQAFNPAAQGREFREAREAAEGMKCPGFRFDGSGRSFQSESVDRHTKNAGGSWFNIAHNTTSGKGQNPDGRQISKVWRDKHYGDTDKAQLHEGIKQPGISGVRANGKGDRWFQDGAAQHGSKSSARKAASAMIAKISLPLSRWIAATYRPAEAVAA